MRACRQIDKEWDGSTLMDSRAALIEFGICVPQSFVTRRNDAYAWIGIIPGMTGTVMPDTTW
jgi:hypothetical protein